MIVRYDRSEAAWKFREFVHELIDRLAPRTVCELGAGANPTLSPEFVRERELDFLVVDVSQEELAKAPDDYRKLCADAAAPDFDLPGRFDLVFSRTVAEHVESGETFHANVYRVLAENGVAFHFFPTLYSPPFVFNRLLPESATARVLELIQSHRRSEGRHGKFPAYYRWCRGPTSRQIRLFEQLGYEIEEYVGFFGHAYYRRVRPLDRLGDTITSLLLRHPVPWLTSYAYVVLRRPAVDARTVS